ncbi:unnamed protein product [Cylindrotheca closterium]|uniref:Uncharacterized protein n=1 Tax=Cylindrotheca closterium TaxID=2856 RepID=A0AAD2FR91_9STRA|nr:unnamed protein product [Cylindrotheca closterium]
MVPYGDLPSMVPSREGKETTGSRTAEKDSNGDAATGKNKPKLALAAASEDKAASSKANNVHSFDITPGATAIRGSKSANTARDTESLATVEVSGSNEGANHSSTSPDPMLVPDQDESFLAAEAIDHDEEVAAAYERGTKDARNEADQLRQQVEELQKQRAVAEVAIPVETTETEDDEEEERNKKCSPFTIFLLTMLGIAGIAAAVILGTRSKAAKDQMATAIPSLSPTLSPTVSPTLSLAPTSTPKFFFQQLGEQLNGSPGDDFGSSISLSSDGRVMAVGAVEIGSTGYVNLYQLDGVTWTLLRTFKGTNSGDMFGHSVSVSGDGNSLAVGIPGPGSDTRNAREGRVKVFDVGSNDTWEAIGNELFGTKRDGGGYFGFSVSLSEDGKMLAVGEPGNGGMNRAYEPDGGRVTVYELINGLWEDIGSPIVDECCLRLGWAVELSAGSHLRIAISGRYEYEYLTQGQVLELVDGDWKPIGQSFPNYELGETALSQDGNVVAFSGINRSSEYDSQNTDQSYPGVVSVHRYNPSTNWTEMGRIEVGNITRAPTVSLSPDGEVLAIGNPVYDSVGRVLLFYYDNSTSTWAPFTEGDFVGRQHDGRFGSSIALVGSKDNFTVAVGSFASNVHGSAGSVAVYNRRFGVVPTVTMGPTPAPTAATVSFNEIYKWHGDDNYEDFIVGNAVSLSKDGRVLAQSYFDGPQTVVKVYEDQSWDDQPHWKSIGTLTSPDTEAKFALSADGRVVALCNNIPSEESNATVSVFQYTGRGRWDQYGADINSARAGDFQEVNYLSLSQNGSTIAIGAILPDDWYEAPVVYRMENGQWEQLGEQEPWTSVTSLSLSCDGNIVAIGDSLPELFGDDTGAAAIFKYVDDKWQQLGQRFSGSGRKIYFGRSVSLSCDGTVVAIGSSSNDIDNGRNVGHVRVYRYSVMANWTQIGKPLIADESGDGFGNSFSLSADGRKLAIGAAAGSYVKVYEYDDENAYWHQVGATLEDELTGSGFGKSVALADTGEGTKLAVGAPFYVKSASALTGRTRLFQEQQVEGTNSPTETPLLAESVDFPLQNCEGDCDTDFDCDRGLLCMQRDGGESVPGCSGGEEDDSLTDYCIKCQDVPGWLDDVDIEWGKNCKWYQDNDAPGCPNWGLGRVGLFGLTAKEACCHCKSRDCGDVPDWSYLDSCTSRDCGDAPVVWEDSSSRHLRCDWYEMFDEIGCPNTGDDWGIAYDNSDGGGSTGMSANDACCHCRTY